MLWHRLMSEILRALKLLKQESKQHPSETEGGKGGKAKTQWPSTFKDKLSVQSRQWYAGVLATITESSGEPGLVIGRNKDRCVKTEETAGRLSCL